MSSPGLLLFSDLHLRPESQETCFQILDDVLITATHLGVGAIGFLGDFFHLRYQVPVHLVNWVALWVERVKKAGKELILLPGNHDMINDQGENALQVFTEWGACVYSEPTIDKWGAWLPYRRDPSVVREQLTVLAKSSVVRLFAHIPVQGARMNNLLLSQDGVLPVDLGGFKRVYLGHFHGRQYFLGGAVRYVGSPWQTRADEAGQQKGYELLVGDEDPKFIPRIFGPRYHVIQGETQEQCLASLAQLNPSSQDIIKVRAPTNVLSSLSHLNGKVVGVATDEEVPKPRYGLELGSSLRSYAEAYATNKGLAVASLQDLMSAFDVLAGEVD
jgi:DNA repair exonuclease SbcCD nuclease subunit